MADDKKQDKNTDDAKVSGGLLATLAPLISTVRATKDWALANRLRAGLLGGGAIVGIVVLITIASFMFSGGGESETEQFTI